MIRKLLSKLLVVGILSAVIAVPSVNAQVANNNSTAGLTVSPVIDEFKIEPGQTVTRTMRVVNPVSQVITLYPVVMNFTTDNQDGKPVFYTTAERSSTYALSDWVSYDKPFIRIAPGEDENYVIKVSAPTTAEPGGHYGAILFSTEEPKKDANSNQVSVVGLIGTLLLATVPGATIEKLAIDDFTAPTILIHGPAKFSLLFSNTGNLHVKPIGEIKIRNWFGNASANLVVNEARGNVLPESKRRFDNSWQFNWKAVGKFTATAVIAYGNPEQQLTMTRTFIIIPLWLIIALSALVLLLVFWIMRRRIRRRQHLAPNVLPPQLPTKPSGGLSGGQKPSVSPSVEKKKFVMR